MRNRTANNRVGQFSTTNEYRILTRGPEDEPPPDHVLFWYKEHPEQHMGRSVTFYKLKSNLIVQSASKVRLDLVAKKLNGNKSNEGTSVEYPKTYNTLETATIESCSENNELPEELEPLELPEDPLEPRIYRMHSFN